MEKEEIILKQTVSYWGMTIIERGALRESEYVMIDAVVVLLGLFSASIFLAHAVDVYQAHEGRRA